MRVLLIDVNCKYSSTGKIVYNLYQAVNASENQAVICYGRGKTIAEKGIYRFAPVWEVYLHAFLTRITGFTGCFSFVATYRLLRYIEDFKPDIVHIHELHGYFVNIRPVVNYLKKRHIRTIWTFHCEFMYTGKCGHAFECEKWKNGCGSCEQLNKYPGVFFFDHTRYMWDAKKKYMTNWPELEIVTPSKWLAERVASSFLNKTEISVIHNDVDSLIFYPRESSKLRTQLKLKDKKVVLAVAPNIMSEMKGGESVVEISYMFQDRKDIVFILIGVDDLKKIRKVGNLIFLPRIRDANLLAEYYSMADVFIICSKRETYPTTCLESLACGTPVCGFDVGGVKETCEEHSDYFVPYGELTSLSQVILKILDSSNKIVSVKGEMTMCNQYLKLYQGQK